MINLLIAIAFICIAAMLFASHLAFNVLFCVAMVCLCAGMWLEIKEAKDEL